MRVLLIILALAYWGVAILAQSYLSRGGAPAPAAQKFSYQHEEIGADIQNCAEERESDLLVAASYSEGAGPESVRDTLTACR